tara:strand:- start:209 stop:325 length:117 start_codon:yes stop_codon:yes gene_type:complete
MKQQLAIINPSDKREPNIVEFFYFESYLTIETPISQIK